MFTSPAEYVMLLESVIAEEYEGNHPFENSTAVLSGSDKVTGILQTNVMIPVDEYGVQVSTHFRRGYVLQEPLSAIEDGGDIKYGQTPEFSSRIDITASLGEQTCWKTSVSATFPKDTVTAAYVQGQRQGQIGPLEIPQLIRNIMWITNPRNSPELLPRKGYTINCFRTF